MRTGPRSAPFGIARGSRRVPALEAFSRTEKIIAFCRVLLAMATLVVVGLDSRAQAAQPTPGTLLLVAYAAYSGLLFLQVRAERLRQELVAPYSTAADVVWISLISVFTEGGVSPFFLLHVFVISSVSVRWGLRATMAVTLLLAALYPVTPLLASWLLAADELGFRRPHLVRPIYLLVLGYLIGYLGEHERRSKRKLGFMLELPAAFRRNRPPGRALARMMGRTLVHFEAQRALLVLRDPDTGRYVTWDVARPGRHTRVGLRITEADPLPVPFATPAEGFLANDLRPGTGTALCYDVLTGAITRKTITPVLALPDPGAAQALIAAPILLQLECRGHALVIREARGKFTRDDLEFLLLLVGQAAAGFENVRLQEKAEEIAVLEERARIARDLHDGFIQSLAGIDLRLEAVKLLFRRDPTRIPRALEELHQAVDRGYRDVRQYMTRLRAPRRTADDLWSSLDCLAGEFASRDRLQVHVELPTTVAQLPAAAGHELAHIVREALQNAVRHGNATQAVVKVGARPSHLYLVVRDNGSGFRSNNGSIDADGFLAPTAAPWSIRERTAALGGSLHIRTQPGHGSEIMVMIPAGEHTGRPASDRRMRA